MNTYRPLCACVIAVLGLYACGAEAQDRSCPPNHGDGEIRGDLNIAARCELSGTEVRGNVILFAGGALIARDVRIRGNLEASRADFIDMEGSRVDGQVQLEELVGDRTTLEGNDFRNDVTLRRNRSRLELLNNELNRDLFVFDNTGGVLLSGNAIGDDLECSGNTPAPLGVGNRVEDESEGQCANLRAEPPAPEPPPPPPEPEPPAPPPPGPGPEPDPEPEPDSEPTPAPAPAPPATPPADTEEPVDEGGVGAIGWPFALLLPLLLRRRYLAARASRSSS